MINNHAEIIATKSSIKAKMAELIDRLTDDQLEHFSYALEHVASCYLNSTTHGALLFANATDESQSLVAINANENQISEMITFMADAMQWRYRTTENTHIN